MKVINNSIIVPVVLTAILMAGLLYFSQHAEANITASQPAPVNKQETYTFFSTSTNQTVYSTSTTAQSTSISSWTDSNGRLDSGYMVVAGADRVTFYFQREGKFGNAGSSAFDVDVSPDGVNWYDFSQLITTTATATKSYVGGYTLTGTSTTIASMELEEHNFFAVRCNVTETTDGEHFCKAQASY